MKKRRTAKACQECGAIFYGGDGCHYCPACAKKRRLDTVVRIRTCQDCGVEFYGGARARRCPDCSYKAAQETNRKFRKDGAKRPLGSTDKCIMCGKEYTVKCGRQKYCSNACARVALLEWKRKYGKEYNSRTGQNDKRAQRRKAQEKICVYCLKKFKSDKPTNLCSDYCRTEQQRIRACIADINRGGKSDYDRLICLRNQYREAVKNNADLSGYSGSTRIDYSKYAGADMSALTIGEQRVIMVRMMKKDMTQKELAALSGYTKSTARTYLCRAVKKLDQFT